MKYIYYSIRYIFLCQKDLLPKADLISFSTFSNVNYSCIQEEYKEFHLQHKRHFRRLLIIITSLFIWIINSDIFFIGINNSYFYFFCSSWAKRKRNDKSNNCSLKLKKGINLPELLIPIQCNHLTIKSILSIS